MRLYVADGYWGFGYAGEPKELYVAKGYWEFGYAKEPELTTPLPRVRVVESENRVLRLRTENRVLIIK